MGSDPQSKLGSFYAGGNINAVGCFGPTFRGVTSGYEPNGNIGGYNAGNVKCESVFGNAHICTAPEMLNSVNCGFNVSGPNSSPPPTKPPLTSSTGTLPDYYSKGLWVSAGTPLPVNPPLNDCQGWTSNSSTNSGAAWYYDSSGGKAFVSNCNVTRMIACCR